MTEQNRIVMCPHCQKELRIDVCSTVTGARTMEEHELSFGPDQWKEGLSDSELALIKQAQISGLLKAFGEAVEQRGGMSSPRSMERFLVTFLRTMAVSRVPEYVIRHYNAEYGRRPLEFWQGQGVCAVIVDGRIRAFVPLQIFKGHMVKSVRGENTKRMGGDEQTLQAWTKTRFGYVPDSAVVFARELRRKSIGEFARPSLSA